MNITPAALSHLHREIGPTTLPRVNPFTIQTGDTIVTKIHTDEDGNETVGKTVKVRRVIEAPRRAIERTARLEKPNA